MNLLNILLQATTGQGGASMWIMLLLMIVIFYFFMIRPQSKKAKEERKFRDSLQKGDKVVTAGGIHGKVAEVKDLTIVIEVANGVNITVEKNFIQPSPEAAAANSQRK
ncbi:MAG: preprotein translocase subunit YajC [Bacteroidales bacterium]|nr:preprotein translocase subunit YajC [Bacteroidales bacterium]